MTTQRPLKVLTGMGKRLEVYDDRVVVRRTDALAMLMPVGFGGQVLARFEQIARVDLHEPETLRLDECEGKCIQLIITRRDHTTVSLTLDREQRHAAKEIRDLIAAHINDTSVRTTPQNNPA